MREPNGDGLLTRDRRCCCRCRFCYVVLEDDDRWHWHHCQSHWHCPSGFAFSAPGRQMGHTHPFDLSSWDLLFCHSCNRPTPLPPPFRNLPRTAAFQDWSTTLTSCPPNLAPSVGVVPSPIHTTDCCCCCCFCFAPSLPRPSFVYQNNYPYNLMKNIPHHSSDRMTGFPSALSH